MIIHASIHLTSPHCLGGKDDSYGTGCRPSNPDPVLDPPSIARRLISADTRHAFERRLAGRQAQDDDVHALSYSDAIDSWHIT